MAHSENKYREHSQKLVDKLRQDKTFYQRSVQQYKDHFAGCAICCYQQALQAQENDWLGEKHIDWIYKTLVAWNMKRAKLYDFTDFKKSIQSCEDLLPPKSLRIERIKPHEYDSVLKTLKKVYVELKVSDTKSTLVVNSKTLALILPNLIAPMDRQYTAKFFHACLDSKTGKEEKLTDHCELFAKLSCEVKWIFDQCDHSCFTIDEKGFNTPYPKIIDNLIIMYVEDMLKEKKRKGA